MFTTISKVSKIDFIILYLLWITFPTEVGEARMMRLVCFNMVSDFSSGNEADVDDADNQNDN